MQRKFFLLICLWLCSCSSLIAEQGTLFTCGQGILYSSTSGVETTAKKAIRKYRNFIRKKNKLISQSKKGSKKRKKAVAAKKNAKQGRQIAKSCEADYLGGFPLGYWVLVTENGLTPAQAGFVNLVIRFTSTKNYSSTYVGARESCSWTGTYVLDDTMMVLTVDSASGPPCDEAVGKSNTAIVTLVDRTLTLDYSASLGGTLQVYRAEVI